VADIDVNYNYFFIFLISCEAAIFTGSHTGEAGGT
jgi:hypothetical protein